MSKNKKTGQKLYKKAKKLIVGGNMLLSKRPEMFLPDNWPSYFSKSKGCYIWDLDGNKYIDMSIMGIGTNILGYNRKEIDDAVIRTVKRGNMSTLNCPEEVTLSEMLIKMNPWASKVKYARSGGEANAISIRIARAATGREKIAVCGYHGWHDWYLSANIGSNKNLDGHLLPGLSPTGVPRSLKGLTIPFNYNEIDEIEKLIKSNELAAVKMEVSRSFGPNKGYLEKIRKLTKKHNTVLIFDECTSGFRETYGGIYKKYDVIPDMIMHGKTLGNGYAISTVIGSEDVMNSAESSFISSTFWTERIGPTAAIETLKIFKQEKPWIFMNKQAKKLHKLWENLAKKHSLDISISGLPVLSNFAINHPDWIKYKTYITQEGLKKGFLMANSVYICNQHNDDVLEKYEKTLDGIFKNISEFHDGKDVNKYLDGPVCHEGFKRLN